MKLISVLLLTLGELGVGTALFVCLQRTGEIRQSFFTFQSWLIATCFFLMSLTAKGAHFYQSTYFSAAVLTFVSGRSFSANRPLRGKGLLLIASTFSMILLTRTVWLHPLHPGFPWLAVINLVCGIFLFGWANGSMILGHWYLIMRDLSFSHFQKATAQLIWAAGLRTLGFGVAYYTLAAEMTSHPCDPLFLGARILWGLLLPLVFGFMAWRCSLTGSNQAGTGLLYIGEVAVLIGEILAGFLGF